LSYGKRARNWKQAPSASSGMPRKQEKEILQPNLQKIEENIEEKLNKIQTSFQNSLAKLHLSMTQS
jgi:hypothetical protein